MATPHGELQPGTRVDRYEVVETLGRGGFGAVYKARHLHLDRLVALKVLHPSHIESRETVERFFREARAAAAAGSPHIVRVIDCGVAAGGGPFLAMELLEGEPLDQLLAREGPLDAERAVGLALQLLDGLATAHAAGVVHRDLKPANVFVTREAETGGELAKLLDFGVSKVQQGVLERALTRTGAWLGTPHYMAPEQLGGARGVDHRGDLYAAAVVLYQMLSGRLPVDARTPAELIYRVTSEPTPSAATAGPHVGPALAAAIDRGLAKDPDARWPDAIAFGAALRAALAEPALTRPAPSSEGLATREASGSVPAAVASAAKDVPSATGVPPAAGTQQRPSSPDALPPTLAGAQPAAPRRGPRTVALLAGVFAAAGLVGGAAVAAGVYTSRGLADRGGSTRSRAGFADPSAALRVEGTSAAPQPAVAAPGQPPPILPAEVGAPAFPVATPAEVGAPAFPAATPAPEGAPAAPDSPEPRAEAGAGGPVRTFGLRVVGQLDAAALEQLLARARPAMARCRQPGSRVQVRVQAHVRPAWASGGRIVLAGPPPYDAVGPDDVARCCGATLGPAVPSGWDPGESGIFSFDVHLE